MDDVAYTQRKHIFEEVHAAVMDLLSIRTVLLAVLLCNLIQLGALLCVLDSLRP